MLKILGHLKPKEWLMALLSLGFIVSQVWLDLKSPEYMAEITTLVQTPGSAMGDIWRAGGMMLFCHCSPSVHHQECRYDLGDEGRRHH